MFDDIISEDFTREDKAVVYVIKALNELADRGLVKGKPLDLTEKGLEMIEGFKPTDEEIELAVYNLKENGYIE